jgi:hypothetical protein
MCFSESLRLFQLWYSINLSLSLSLLHSLLTLVLFVSFISIIDISMYFF